MNKVCVSSWAIQHHARMNMLSEKIKMSWITSHSIIFIDTYLADNKFDDVTHPLLGQGYRLLNSEYRQRTEVEHCVWDDLCDLCSTATQRPRNSLCVDLELKASRLLLSA